MIMIIFDRNILKNHSLNKGEQMGRRNSDEMPFPLSSVCPILRSLSPAKEKHHKTCATAFSTDTSHYVHSYVKRLCVPAAAVPWSVLQSGMESSRQMPRLEAASRQFFLSWLGLASVSHGLASVSTLLPRLCLIVSASVLARSGT